MLKKKNVDKLGQTYIYQFSYAFLCCAYAEVICMYFFFFFGFGLHVALQNLQSN